MIPWLKFFLLISISTGSLATELVHRFANPNFIGGNPSMGQILLNEANAQNFFKAPVVIIPKANKPTPLEQIASRIQSSLISNLANAQSKEIKDSLIDSKTGLIIPGVRIPITGGYIVETRYDDGDGVYTEGSVIIKIISSVDENEFTEITLPDAKTY